MVEERVPLRHMFAQSKIERWYIELKKAVASKNKSWITSAERTLKEMERDKGRIMCVHEYRYGNVERLKVWYDAMEKGYEKGYSIVGTCGQSHLKLLSPSEDQLLYESW